MLSIVFCLSFTVSVAVAQSYAPINVTCPDNLIRYGNNGLSPREAAYISQRKTKATQNLLTWLQGLHLADFNATSFLSNDSNTPTMGLAFSGGGYRAMLNGAGVFQGIIPRFKGRLIVGLDSRINGNGNMSGFLQSMTYIAGLSGGSWLIGAIAVNDFATIDTMRNERWHLQDNLVAPSGFINLVTFYDDLYHQVQEKADVGFDTYTRSGDHANRRTISKSTKL
jgi:lysophospholipase